VELVRLLVLGRARIWNSVYQQDQEGRGGLRGKVPNGFGWLLDQKKNLLSKMLLGDDSFQDGKRGGAKRGRKRIQSSIRVS